MSVCDRNDCSSDSKISPSPQAVQYADTVVSGTDPYWQHATPKVSFSENTMLYLVFITLQSADMKESFMATEIGKYM